MSLFEVNKNPTDRDLRMFGWAMVGGFGVLGSVLWCLAYVKADPARGLFDWSGQAIQIVIVVMWCVGLGLWALSRISPAVTKPVYIVWMSAAAPVGVFMTGVLLTVLFVTLLAPFSLIRLGDPLRKKLTKGGTYWEDHRPYEATLDRMMRLF